MHHSLCQVLEKKGIPFYVSTKNTVPMISVTPSQNPGFLELIITLGQINKTNGDNPVWLLAPNDRDGEPCLTLTYSSDPSKYGLHLKYLACLLNGNTL